MTDDRELTIGRIARQAGVGVETVRFYERRGLVERPQRPHGDGYRVYPVETVQRIRFIRQAQTLGFSLHEIADLLSLRADPAGDCADIRLRAAAKRDQVTQKIAELDHMRRALDALIAACPGRGAVRHCTILDALTDAEEPPCSRSETA